MTDINTIQCCPNCKRSIPPEWKSEFDTSNIHYKNFECCCGYTISIKVDFAGCGIDTWNDNIEKKINEVESKLQKQ